MHQVMAMSTGKPLRLVDEAMASKTAQQIAEDSEMAESHFTALKRVLNRACMLDAEGAMELETEATVEGFLHPETAEIVARFGKKG